MKGHPNLLCCPYSHLTEPNHAFVAGSAFEQQFKMISMYNNYCDMMQFKFGFSLVMLFKGIVRMDPLNNLVFSSEEPCETGDIDQFNSELIPLHSNSFLGQFLIWSASVMAFQVRFYFLDPMIRWRCFFNSFNIFI